MRRTGVVAVDGEYPVGGVHVRPGGDGGRDVGHVDGARVGVRVVEDLQPINQ